MLWHCYDIDFIFRLIHVFGHRSITIVNALQCDAVNIPDINDGAGTAYQCNLGYNDMGQVHAFACYWNSHWWYLYWFSRR